MTKEKKVSITIDNKKVEVRPHLTILEAARSQGVYIPSLCALESLPSYGACRLCVVEVDGLRGFPTSCTTPVEEGMVIRTDTGEIRSLRQEVLKLLLSEHPASCLFCTEQTECKDYQGTIRKAGVITGCRYCPNDNRCELQQVTERIGLTETSYPVYYRNFPVEKNDPFYDRDYNLCILCGRCVRVCNSVRLNGTLSFKQRGKMTTVGPAFDRTHLEAGCEFCGACVSVCPTGALAAKVSKWYGKADREVATTCIYCPVGCTLKLQVRKNEVLDALPDYESAIDHGLVCVKGRFAIPEYVHSPLRIDTPKRISPTGYEDISWEQAALEAATRLRAVKTDEFLMVVSPQMTNEDLFAAQQFARQVMGSDNIASSVIFELGENIGPFLNLASQSDAFDVLDTADAILALGFDSTYGYAPIGVGVKKAAQRGAVVVTIDSRDANLDMIAEMAFKCDEEKWPALIGLLAGAPLRGAAAQFPLWKEDIGRLSMVFKKASAKLIVAGPGLLNAPDTSGVLDQLLKVREKDGWGLIVAHPYSNLRGMLAMGALPGLKPGEIISSDNRIEEIKCDLTGLNPEKRRSVVYCVGEAAFDAIPDCDYLIYQNALPIESLRKPDLLLPVALFTESAGTVINGEGRILPVTKAVEPSGDSKPDWWILSAIADKVKKGAMRYKDTQSVQGEIRKYIKGFPGIKKKLSFSRISAKRKASKGVPVHGATGRFRYRGIPLDTVVQGMKDIEERVQSMSYREEGAI
jgi:formate dehydrogenase alpha subunit